MTCDHHLILASESPYKRRLFARLGIPFDCAAPNIEETRQEDEPPTDMTLRLAAEKALAVAKRAESSFILAADQTIAIGDRIFHKPATAQRAKEQLSVLQGQSHRLINSVVLRKPGGTFTTTTSIYEMVMRPLSPAQISAYVEADRPLDCAGSYRIESQGIRLFEATRGDDPSAIEGLPLIGTWSLLLDAGWPHD